MRADRLIELQKKLLLWEAPYKRGHPKYPDWQKGPREDRAIRTARLWAKFVRDNRLALRPPFNVNLCPHVWAEQLRVILSRSELEVRQSESDTFFRVWVDLKKAVKFDCEKWMIHSKDLPRHAMDWEQIQKAKRTVWHPMHIALVGRWWADKLAAQCI